jgi:hypothetical protein
VGEGPEQEAPVADGEEESVGAFTVANKNDTDVNASDDVNDQNVSNSQRGGENEKDLMKLVVSTSKTSGRVKLTVVSGSIKLWEKSTKETEITLTQGSKFFAVGELPKTLWIEATNTSAHVRDIQLKAGWEEDSGVLHDNLDTVKATGIWVVKKGRALNRNTDPWFAKADDQVFRNTFEQHLGASFGLNFNAPDGDFHFGIGFEFQVLPEDLGNPPGVRFDITRQAAAVGWFRTGPHEQWRQMSWLDSDSKGINYQMPVNDVPNDDQVGRPNFDHDVVPNEGLIQSIDGPGQINDGVNSEVVVRYNFYEYVRVRFDSVRPDGNSLDGSRCSPKYPWYVRYWVEQYIDPEEPPEIIPPHQYRPKPNEPNDVDEGHMPLGVPPPQ